jgi:hypothetical protein
MTAVYAKKMFSLGRVGDFVATPQTIRTMAARFQDLAARGMVLPVYLEHDESTPQPFAKSAARRMALADRRLVGYVSDIRPTPRDDALHVQVTFLRQRGRDHASANRMGLSPVFSGPGFLNSHAEIISASTLVAIDIVTSPADKTQGPFRPVTRMQLSHARRPKPKTKGAKRMAKPNEIGLPPLSEPQVLALKYLARVIAKVEPLAADAFRRSVELCWPDSVPEICQSFQHDDAGQVTETAPEFAAMSLHTPGRPATRLYDEPSRQSRIDSGDPEMIDAKAFVDAQAKRLSDIRR